MFLWTGMIEDSASEDCRYGVWEVHRFRTGHVKFKMPFRHPHGKDKWTWIYPYIVCVYVCIYMCICICVCIYTHTHKHTEKHLVWKIT